MNIRRCNDNDVDAVIEILNESIINDTARFDEKPFGHQQAVEWYKSHNDMYPIFVAEDNGEIKGWACISALSDKSAYRYTVENSVYVHKDFRGKGLGKKLLEYTVKISRNLGYKAIIAVITSDNVVSIKLHKDLDFSEVGEMKKVGYKFNKWLDVTMMEIELD